MKTDFTTAPAAKGKICKEFVGMKTAILLSQLQVDWPVGGGGWSLSSGSKPGASESH